MGDAVRERLHGCFTTLGIVSAVRVLAKKEIYEAGLSSVMTAV